MFASILIQTKPSLKHTTFGEAEETVHCKNAKNFGSQEFVEKSIETTVGINKTARSNSSSVNSFILTLQTLLAHSGWTS